MSGVYFSKLKQDSVVFRAWVLDFIEYHIFRLIRTLLIEDRNNTLVIQLIAVRYWFFLFQQKDNYIKSVFKLKTMVSSLQNQSAYFRILEKTLSSMIENKIKEHDKANAYSYRRTNVKNAQMYLLFENQVLAYDQIYRVKVTRQAGSGRNLRGIRS